MSLSLSFGGAVAVFCVSLVLSIASSFVLADSLDKIGARLHLSEGLLGIIIALGADSPEISSAVAAILGGQHDLSVGVVLGSNIFNLAALLGLSAVVAGQVHIGRQGLLFNGGVALLVTAIITGLLLGVISPIWSIVLSGILLVPYIVLSALRPPQVQQLHLPGSLEQFFSAAVGQMHKDARKDQPAPHASLLEALSSVLALASIVVASFGMVQSSVVLARIWELPHIIVGTLILATLTGIPNLLAAMRLALHGRGAAVVSEALNSNTLNLLAGICLPILLLGQLSISHQSVIAIWWLLGMTAVTLVLLGWRCVLTRWGGVVIIALYAGFVGLVIFGR